MPTIRTDLHRAARALFAIGCFVLSPCVLAEPDPGRAYRLVSDSDGADSFGFAAVTLDFDGDGAADVAVSDIGEATDTGERGVVRIFRRTINGFESSFIFDINDGSARFGQTLAAGDFDEDGRDDLLIGAPGAGSNGGAVYLVRHTSPSDTTLSAPISHLGSNFGQCGSSLAVGDFDADGNLDFIAGCPTASFDAHTSVGRIEYAYGFGNGAFSTGLLSQATAGIAGSPETGDGFGASLAAGDFNCDLIDDLAVGAPYEDVDAATDNGAFHILFGVADDGLVADDSQLWHQGVADVPGDSGNEDHLALALAAADFDRPPNSLFGCDDLAIGIPDDAQTAGGAVLVMSGTSAGLVTTGAMLLSNDDFLPDPFAYPYRTYPDDNARFGVSLHAAEVGRGTRPDLIIGVEGYQPILSTPQTGLACIAFAAPSVGLLGAGQRCYSGREFNDAANLDRRFGTVLAAGNVDDTPVNELIIGSPGSQQVFVLLDSLFRDGFDGNAD